jgi:hypothetical protein
MYYPSFIFCFKPYLFFIYFMAENRHRYMKQPNNKNICVVVSIAVIHNLYPFDLNKKYDVLQILYNLNIRNVI